MNSGPHQTVLLKEAVHALIANANGTYVDCTYGRGGHSQAIADQLGADGRLLVIDRDEAAIADAAARFKDDDRVVVQQGPFSKLRSYVHEHQLGVLDGVLLDLGVSSPQLDEAGRGFSFQQDGPLDMRMDQTQGETAADWVMQASEKEIIEVLKTYGEERFARRIARNILAARAEGGIDTTGRLVEIIEASVPRREKHKHPATRSFQAIRIRVNRELDELETCLHDVIELLNSGGRLVVISFHSLEDRIVKRFFRRMANGEELPSRLPVRDDQIKDRYIRVVGKPVRASEAELELNRRSRSSIMRIAEKL